MKIGVTCYPTYGGSGVVATELGLELARRGHDIHFITYAPPVRLTGFEEHVTFHEVSMMEYPLFQYPPYDLALASRMAEVAEFQNLDVLHVHYALPHALSAYLAKQMLARRGISLPIITTLHGTDITLVGKDPSLLPITQFGIECSDIVTAISDHLAEETRKHFNVTRPITVIKNFVDCNYYRNLGKSPWRGEGGLPTLVHLSNFREVKRVTDVVRVFAKVSQSIEVRLLMIGDGPERSKAERLARELGVFEQIRFLGKQNDVLGLLNKADIMVMPSAMESFGLAALEAMACSLPVIATRVGGVPELITHGHDGFLYEVGDIEGMSRGVLTLLKNPSYTAAMGDAARKTVESRFCADKIIPQYVEIYRRAIAQS